MGISHLHRAKRIKFDEYYTLYEDVELELNHYIDQFQDKIIYCPCDSSESAFVKYFTKLKEQGVVKEILHSSIDDFCFDSPEAIELYKKCDIVVTNPPFSVLAYFLTTLEEQNKKYISWGAITSVSNKKIWNLFFTGKIKLGYLQGVKTFEVPEEYKTIVNKPLKNIDGKYYTKIANICVFTNLEVKKENKLDMSSKYKLIQNLTCCYDPIKYPKYDNYDAININKLAEIPIDYFGEMGVPITYLYKHDPEEFEIIGMLKNHKGGIGYVDSKRVETYIPNYKTSDPVINKKVFYFRIIIKRREQESLKRFNGR